MLMLGVVVYSLLLLFAVFPFSGKLLDRTLMVFML